VLHCLCETLLYTEGDEAVTYAEAAHLAAQLIDESVERLDSVRLKPMIEAIRNAAGNQGLTGESGRLRSPRAARFLPQLSRYLPGAQSTHRGGAEAPFNHRAVTRIGSLARVREPLSNAAA
jgi:hypothetical protein